MNKVIALMMLLSFMAPGVLLGRFKAKITLGLYNSLFVGYMIFFVIVGIYISVFYDYLDPRR
jgi:hypothetical protein